jgi:predicted RNA polymerase sigma factor
MKAAKRRAIDSLRRGRMLVQKREEIARELEWQQQRLGDALEHSLDQVIDDDVLRLIFTASHPVLAAEGHIALRLRLIGGLTTPEIARAFLVPEKTLGQRISRAKKTLSEPHVPLVTPSGGEFGRRVESVLMVVYLIFNEGYTATSGDEWMRAALSEGGGAKPYALQAAIAACHMRGTASFFCMTPCRKSIHLQSWHSIAQSPSAWCKAQPQNSTHSTQPPPSPGTLC